MSKDSIINEINLSPEGVKIQANKIRFEGLVTANENFKILLDGSIEAKNGSFSGTITGTTITGGTITGATIRTSTGSGRIQLTSNALESYLNNVRRVKLDYDSLDFYTPDNRLGGEIVATVDSLFNQPALTLRCNSGMARIQSRVSSTNYAEVFAIGYHGGDGTAEAGITVRQGDNEGWVEVGPGGVFLNGRHGSRVTTLLVSGEEGVTVYGAFSVTGQKSAVVKTEDYGWRKLYALETPDNRFVTYVEKELPIGEHYIEIEPMFRQTISDYFVVPHIQNMASVYIVEILKNGFKVLVENKPAQVVFEINGRRKGYEDVYMEEVNYEHQTE